ncbi:hypothetical protein HCBG_04853 [Histoplasma capsulatum G186AR]|uniref:Uncharacterized protein n=1 Tax=Ajellomyces capsulatus (strain G186AR / H82 / ATCC MYA-2454 / RMSCC 2432) TaxID=447093 RepID=C0NNX3_AJECG|nr:uncharacterized protein HCBG_04853 [Histoplasma capsulatum G186AR]EEH06633.1 hypothetical protein HCBG_04853 [Histoplasma capsulatum G186AR]
MDDALRVKKLKEEKQMRLSRFCAPKEKQEDFYRYLESLKIKKMPQTTGILFALLEPRSHRFNAIAFQKCLAEWLCAASIPAHLTQNDYSKWIVSGREGMEALKSRRREDGFKKYFGLEISSRIFKLDSVNFAYNTINRLWATLDGVLRIVCHWDHLLPLNAKHGYAHSLYFAAEDRPDDKQELEFMLREEAETLNIGTP